VRLHAVEHGHRLPQRLKLILIRLLSGRRVPDVVKTLFYRPEFFGRPMCDWTQAVMRGPSPWSVGERELFAAFTSRLNQCLFWTGAHGAVASLALKQERKDDTLVEAVLRDWRTAPLDPKLRAMLGFLEKLTLAPTEVGPADVKPLRAAGVTDEAVEDAIQVCVLFNIYDRLADSLRFHLPGPDGYAASGRNLMKRGYLL
jgi:uncharacterized peroxidase-related enzyme